MACSACSSASKAAFRSGEVGKSFAVPVRRVMAEATVVRMFVSSFMVLSSNSRFVALLSAEKGYESLDVFPILMADQIHLVFLDQYQCG